MLKYEISKKVNQAIKQFLPEYDGSLPLEKPKNPDFGDFAVNVSPLAKYAKMPPPKIAEAISGYLDMNTSVVAGFINFKVEKQELNRCIREILAKRENFGRNNLGNGEKVILEYVSANPTGPLHIGHGRWAATGSALANLLNFSGYEVYQEFYINDAGKQIENLGKSLEIRVKQEKGENIDFPEDTKNYYTGEFLIDVAKKYIEEGGNRDYSEFARKYNLEQQKKLLDRFGVNFNDWFSETSLYHRNEVSAAIKKLEESGKLYKKDGALWFKSSDYGDDQDRVIIKQDGTYTYLAADIAYHYNKLNRGFERLINIWGADHHGYVARVKASIEAMGRDSSCFEVLLGQLVNLIISGEHVRMGKRRKMVTLEELIEEVGIDGTRFWMIMRDINNTLDFDVRLAASCSDENPVYYCQYAYARACSILKTAISQRIDRETGQELPPLFKELDFNTGNLDFLWQEEGNSTKTLILRLESFDDIVETAARLRAPYMIARYALDLAKDFHHFYAFTRVLNEEEGVMKARLCLVEATRQIMANALNLLGVSTPERM